MSETLALPADEVEDFAVLTLGRIQYMELVLDRLSKKIMAICAPEIASPAEIRDVHLRSKMAGATIRGYEKLLDMRFSLHERQKTRTEALKEEAEAENRKEEKKSDENHVAPVHARTTVSPDVSGDQPQPATFAKKNLPSAVRPPAEPGSLKQRLKNGA